MSTHPRVAVVLCTHHPRKDLLNWSLASLEQQTMPAAEFEVIVVDSGSPLPVSELPVIVQRRNFLRVVREEDRGLTRARVTGIAASTAPLLVFVDDDNYLDPQYLELAAAIADGQPHLGCFGGKAHAVLEKPVPGWKHRLLGYLGARDYGPRAISSANRRWGAWEPIGAGMVCRRDVARQFSSWVQSVPDASRLGRSGRHLMSGEDSLIAQAAYSLGYHCSYQPSLELAHWMKAGRLNISTLARTLAGHGRSHVVLQALKGEPIPRPAFIPMSWQLLKNYRYHVHGSGLGSGTLKWFFDWGYYREARR